MGTGTQVTPNLDNLLAALKRYFANTQKVTEKIMIGTFECNDDYLKQTHAAVISVLDAIAEIEQGAKQGAPTAQEPQNALPAGWGKPTFSKQYHYFPAGKMTSLCSGYGFFGGEREDGLDNHPENCTACMRRVKKLRESRTK